MISDFKHYFLQVPCESAAKSKKNTPFNPTIKLSNWNTINSRVYFYVNVWTWEVLEYSLSVQNCLRNMLHPYYVYNQLGWRKILPEPSTENNTFKKKSESKQRLL